MTALSMQAIELTHILAWHAQNKVEGVAYRLGEQVLSWRELDQQSDVRAAALAAYGVEHDHLVAISLPNGPDFIASIFAVWKCGATPLPLSPHLAPEECRAILELGQARVYIAPQPCPGSAVPHLSGDFGSAAPAPRGRTTTTHWKACTSGGSTGRPKIIVDHRPGAFSPDTAMFFLPRDGVVLNTAPLYHNGPFSAVNLALFKGCTVIDMRRFDAEHVLQLIEQHRVAWIYLVPTMMHRIWQLGDEVRGRYDVSSVKMAFHTAGPIPRWLKQAWIEWLGPDHIGEVYGATEGLGRTWISGHEWLERPGSVGQISGGAKLRILAPDGSDCASGDVGEVFLMPADGPGTTYHYLGATARRTADGWESVGDLGWLDDAGYLYLADRRDDMIICGGVNIYPAEVEAALLAHEQVASAVVIGLKDDEYGQRVHAVVQRRAAALSAEDLRNYLSGHLEPIKVPKSFEFVDHPVRDDAGKVRRSAMRGARDDAAGRGTSA